MLSESVTNSQEWPVLECSLGDHVVGTDAPVQVRSGKFWSGCWRTHERWTKSAPSTWRCRREGVLTMSLPAYLYGVTYYASVDPEAVPKQ